MTALPALRKFESPDHEIFAPVPAHQIAKLVEERHRKRGMIGQLSDVANGDGFEGVVEYFTTQTRASSVPELFDRQRAWDALDADCWRRALSLTDIYDILPQERRDEWEDLIRERETPEFVEEVVGPTLSDLLAKRPQFLAERVDGLFRALSGEHVTNSPWGFGKRMILANVTDKYKMANRSQCGHINDLRAVIAKIEGRDQPPRGMTASIARRLRHEDTGTWYDLDGGAIRIRVYKKGTAHIEIHPDMAWRLNAILAEMHPRAIPSEHREPPKRKTPDVEITRNLIPFEVLRLIDQMSFRGDRVLSFGLSWSRTDKHLRSKTKNVLQALGAVVEDGRARFDYDPTDVIERVIAVGAIPDQKSHQYYATPDDLAEAAVSWADIGPEHRCLEPSAGQGALAAHMPADRTQCVEISEIHAEILQSKGFDVDQADFLEWSDDAPLFDRIVMNPPYSEGRWQAHLDAACGLLAPRGVLVAILPSTAQGSVGGGMSDVTWSEARSFAGVSIDVRMVRIEREVS